MNIIIKCDSFSGTTEEGRSPRVELSIKDVVISDLISQISIKDFVSNQYSKNVLNEIQLEDILNYIDYAKSEGFDVSNC